MAENLTYKRFGEKAILIEWKSVIDDFILNDILIYKEKLLVNKNVDFVDLIQGYNSLTVIFRSYIKDFKKQVSILKTEYKSTQNIKEQKYYQWEIPVCYDLEFGIDLKEISQKSNLDIQEIINLHSEVVYKIYFIGFLPGFLYLGGLNERLYFDRKPNPRLNVVKGAVGIGGMQTGVYPNVSAGGWNIIGKTPIHFFDLEKEVTCFAKAGDFIKFKSISLEEFYHIENEILKNKYQLIKIFTDA